MNPTAPKFPLDLKLDPQSGQILSLGDPSAKVEFLRCGPGAELELNGLPLALRLREEREGSGEHISLLEARSHVAYGAASSLRIRRVLTCGGVGLHPGRSGSVHLRYEFLRVPNNGDGDNLGYIWKPEIEAPLQVETLTVLTAPSLWFGEKTRMRAIAIGGSGPREHVSFEDGPVAEVVPHLQTGFRNAFPGQPLIAGALYYHPDDGRFVWVVARRPATGGRLQFGRQRQAFQFDYFTGMGVNDELFTPAVSFLWGRGLEEAERVLAGQFDRYEEPPDWWSKTTWFWLHPNWQRDASFETMAKGAEVLMDECGVNGFGLFTHDVPSSGHDCDVASPRPSPTLGGDAELRRAIDRIRAKGGHTYTWISRHGHRADSPGWQPSWGIRGVDGRSIRLRSPPSRGVSLDIVNCADPSFQDYIMRWIEYSVKHLGITGLFWDSGLQPLPPDFGGKPYLRWPGETSARALEFYEKVYRFGRTLSPDFFMWVEGISVDAPMNAFAVDNRSHGPNSGHGLMRRIAHAGPKRLVWRSAWPHDLGSGFPFIEPFSDIHWEPAGPKYKAAAADPMNRWVCRIVRERGCRHAIGLADGVSLLDEFVVACPSVSGPVMVPKTRCKGASLRHVVSGATVKGATVPEGVRFDLPASGAWEMRS